MGMSVAALAFFGIRHVVFFEMRAVCDVKLFADDWIYAVGVAYMLKVQHAEHISVVGERKGTHIEFFCSRYQCIKFACSVKKRII